MDTGWGLQYEICDSVGWSQRAAGESVKPVAFSDIHVVGVAVVHRTASTGQRPNDGGSV
jgi:hypothetical protein